MTSFQKSTVEFYDFIRSDIFILCALNQSFIKWDFDFNPAVK